MVFGIILAKLKRHKEKLLDNGSKATQVGSQPEHSKGVTIDRAIAMWHARKPQPFEINPITLVIYK